METDAPQAVYTELKKLPKNPLFIYSMDRNEKVFLPIHKEEEAFLDSVLSDGLMRVSYIHMDKDHRIDVAIGPLEGYLDRIERLDIAHRRALVRLSVAGEEKQVKFGLWLDRDPKIEWIEEEKERRKQNGDASLGQNEEEKKHRKQNGDASLGRIEEAKEHRKQNDGTDAYGKDPGELRERKAGKRNRAEEDRNTVADTERYRFMVGDRVINTSGIFGDMPLEVVRIDPIKNTIKVKAELFGKETIVEMALDEVVKCEGIRQDRENSGSIK